MQPEDSAPASEAHYDGPGASSRLSGFDEHPIFMSVGAIELLVVPADATVTISRDVKIDSFNADLSVGSATLHVLDRAGCDPDCIVVVELEGLVSTNRVPADARGVVEIEAYSSAS